MTSPNSRRLRFRSRKQAAVYIERRKLVASLLQERPACERCQAARSTECHELLSRARGGSILNPENVVCLCHQCHSWITTHPAEATAEGWLKSRWSA